MDYLEIYDKTNMFLNDKQIALVYDKIGGDNNTVNSIIVLENQEQFLSAIRVSPSGSDSISIIFGNELALDKFNPSRKYAVLYKDYISSYEQVILYRPNINK